jgi:hypothetical protein
MDKVKRDFADLRFTVRQGPSAWIMCEPMSRELTLFGSRGFLEIQLREGTTPAQAQDIARILQNHVTEFTFTPLKG